MIFNFNTFVFTVNLLTKGKRNSLIFLLKNSFNKSLIVVFRYMFVLSWVDLVTKKCMYMNINKQIIFSIANF